LVLLSDEHLACSCGKGNKGHCRLLFERYRGYVWNLIRKMVDEPSVTEDLTQEVFLRVFRGLGGYRGEASFKTWLTRIAVNLCREYMGSMRERKWASRVQLDGEDDMDFLASDLESNQCDPAREITRVEVRQVVQKALSCLSPDHRITIALLLEDRSYAEIAEITGIPVRTVGSRIHYAKQKLRKILEHYVKGNEP